ncbi:MAG TPA: hypothetical protein VIN40_06410 [Candidatus Tyrphobacter sp.]
MRYLATLSFVLASLSGVASAQTAVSPAVLLAHGATYDAKRVTVAGTVAKVVHKTSSRGNAYTTFDLCAGSQCIRVFEFGTPSISAGSTLTVTGTFAVEKHVGSVVYRNELDVESGN